MLPLHRRLSHAPIPLLLAIALAAILLIALLQRLAGLPDALWALHLAPVALASWYAGRGWGGVLATVALLASEVASRAAEAAAAVEIPLDGELVAKLGMLLGLVLFLGTLRNAAEDAAERPLRLDPSTGLLNTRALFDLVAGEVERAQRYERPFTLLYLSVDNLPQIRQRRGTDEAEEILRRVAHHLKGSLRTVDVVARLRDREFAALLPETETEAADVVVARIRRTLLASTAEDPEGIRLAIGAITWLRSDLSVDALHQRTYQLLYTAQRDDSAVCHEVLDGDTVDQTTHRHLTLQR